MEEADQQAVALQAVGSLTGDTGISPVATTSHDWAADTFARGAYPGPEPLPEDLMRPIGKQVFWAGMITETIDESYDSGREAGMQALRTLN